MAECYIVVGPPRTGTSLTMGIVAKLGVYIGGEENMRDGPNNPNYYEHKAVAKFMHQKIGPQELVDTLYKEPKWAMKHPRFLWHWETFEDLIENPRFILTHRRDLKAQIRSHKRAIQRQPKSKVIDRNNWYYIQANAVRAKHPMIDVWFEDYFDPWKNREQVQRIADFCGRSVTQAALALANPRHSKFYNGNG